MQQNPILGFFLALTAAMAWGASPIALKQVLAIVDSPTTIFYRFATASLVLLVFLAWKKQLPKLNQFNPRVLVLFLLGVVGLAGNFFLYNASLIYVEPAITQIFSPITSFGMLIAGVWVFKEKLGMHQKIGLILLIIGLGLFFNERFSLFFTLNLYSLGIFFGLSAAVIFVLYGIAQKILVRFFSTPQILLLSYFACMLTFLPQASVGQVRELTPFAWGWFIYCCLNTPLAFGAYAEALNRWEVSKVSVVASLGSLFVLLFSHLLHWLDPLDFERPEFNALSYIGACLSIVGVMSSAIGHKFYRTENVNNA
ncbi:DMT family transporter [Lonepinella sp. BR2271]|uniref:DMT family transporter n=1 Tax=Lonepinella sp. BR2271 TaxID=3434550 RepID=UPI003F6E40D7